MNAAFGFQCGEVRFRNAALSVFGFYSKLYIRRINHYNYLVDHHTSYSLKPVVNKLHNYLHLNNIIYECIYVYVYRSTRKMFLGTNQFT